MATLPTPLRAALGLAATAIDEARKLPETLPQLPVAVIGSAMQASLRVQQHIAEYAARGDELISQLRGGSDEPPSWATFDDDTSSTGGSTNGGSSNGGPAKAAFELIDEGDAVVEADALPASPTAGPATETAAPTPAQAQAKSEAKAAPAKKAAKKADVTAKKAPAPKTPATKTPAVKATKAPAAKKAAKKTVHSEPLAQAAERAEPTDRPNPSVLAAEIAQAHPGETQPGAAH